MTTSARDLSARLANLLRHERDALADFLVALADFDRRRLWVELGYSSLFYFLHRELGLSKGAAFYRKTAAELMQKCPDLVEPLRDGRLCLTSIVELAKVLTPANRDEVLPRFFHASKAEAKAVSAALQPDSAAPRRDVVTPVRTAVPVLDGAGPHSPEEDRHFSGEAAVHLENLPHANSEPAPQLVPPLPRDAAEPLTADLRRLHVTVSRRFLEKLDAARDALSHARPGASTEEIL
jgi:HNH endonuclease